MPNPNIYVFDLDLTLWNGFNLYKDVLPILLTLREKGHYIYLASFNMWAPRFLNYLGIKWLFHGGEYGYSVDRSKHDMIQNILKVHNNTGRPTPNYIFFFDDQVDNIADVATRSNGTIYAMHTPNGLKWSHILDM